jgi:hypothetical protein
MTEYIFIISLFWDGCSKMYRNPKTQGSMSVECRPNFQNRPQHLLRQEPSYTSSSLMRAPWITHLNCTESNCIFNVSIECPNFQHHPHHLLCREPSYTLSSLMRTP